MPVTRPVRVVTGCNSSTPVRVVTAGGDPIRIVTEGVSDPVRIVTSGVSTPVVVIGGGLGPDAPTFVSGEVGTVDASTVVVTFSTDITAPCGDCGLGFAVLVNGAPNAITACVIVGGNTVRLTLTNPVVFGDVVTVSYDNAVGCIMESTGTTDLATFPAQAVTNNVVAWYRSGGAPAPIAVYEPKGAANLAASYINLVNPGTYDAVEHHDGGGVALTWDAVNGWKFTGGAINKQWLDSGVVPASGYSMIVRFSNISVLGWLAGVYKAALNNRFSIGETVLNPASIEYGSGKTITVALGGVYTSGVLAVAGQQGYRDGVADGGAIAAWDDTISSSVGIARMNDYTTYCGVYIQALVIWDTAVGAATWIPAVSAAMALL